jgi:hypothetical protein
VRLVHKEELKKVPENKLFRASTSSFHSEQDAKQLMNSEQQEKLKKSTRKPFDVSKKRANLMQEADDLLSELSTPDVNYGERSKIMDILAKRDKDREELELDNCFN